MNFTIWTFRIGRRAALRFGFTSEDWTPQCPSGANASIGMYRWWFLRCCGVRQSVPEQLEHDPGFFLVRHCRNVRAASAELEMSCVGHIAADFAAATSGDSCGGEF